MIGKRGIKMKRPAVLCAAAFVAGILLEGFLSEPVIDGYAEFAPLVLDAGWIVAGIVLGLFTGGMVYLHRLMSGGNRVSALDKLVLFVPVFLLSGFLVMKHSTAAYEANVQAFSECMTDGRELLAEGTVSHIRRTKTGLCLELKDASVASYIEKETIYRPVGTLLVYVEDLQTEKGEVKHGQKIFVYGSGSIFEEAPNPGGFDAKQYYFSLGITGAIHGKTIRITDGSYHRLSQALFQAKNALLNSYVTYLGEEGAGVISSMLLGERALLSEETQELYRHGGISHILAISGLHVSLIGMALYNFLRKTILGRNGAIPVACAGVVLYGTFVEAGTSTKRAVIMFLLMLLAVALGRTYDTLSAMSVSMIIILCGSPGVIYTASFQLSFAAAYGASVMAVVLKERQKEHTSEEKAVYAAKLANRCWFRLREYFAGKLKSMFVFGLAIQAVTFPFTVYHFFEYPTYGFFLNPVVVPLMTILLLCGLLSGVCGLFVPWLGYFFAGGTGGILWIYERLCQGVEKLPGSLLLFGRPSIGQMLLYFIVLAGCVCVWHGRERKRVKRSCAETRGIKDRLGAFGWSVAERVSLCLGDQKVILCCLLFLPVCLLPFSDAQFEVAFLDVGQGDGIVLQERNGAVLLVDGGSTSVQKVGEKRMIPYLKSRGIRVIDCAFVSHTDSDHMSGMKEILEAMPVYSEYRESVLGYMGTPMIKCIVLPGIYGTVWEPEEAEAGQGVVLETWEEKQEIDEAYLALVKLAKEKNVEVNYMTAGDRMKVGKNLVFTCFSPEEGVSYADKNTASMVLLATYGEFDLLLTGDIDKEGEKRVLGRGVHEQCFDEFRGSLLDVREEDASETMSRETDSHSGKELSLEVLKVAHHGSHTASSEEFITTLAPQISIISCGKDNRYGHPHNETLETLYEANSKVYRTDESGCVTIKVGKKGRFRVDN